MKLAFSLFKYFPFGGLSYNFRTITSECLARGHHIRVYTHAWQGDMPEGIDVIIVPRQGVSNYVRQQGFYRFVKEHLEQYPVDLLVGFNKMPGLDLYYAADNCQAEKIQDKWHAWLPRYRHFVAYEDAVFRATETTRIMLIAQQQIDEYKRHYATPDERLHLLPPGIKRDRCAHEESPAIGRALREELGIDVDTVLLLAVGSGFKTKGLDRSLQAIAALPDSLRRRCLLLVIGQDNFKSFAAMASRLSVSDRVRYIGARADIPRFLFAADLLLHPAYNEAAGMSLLEAGVAGLPVLASGACGFSNYIEEFNFGRVVPEPFDQQIYVEQLEAMLMSEKQRQIWSENGVRFGQTQNIYDRAQQASDYIEQLLELRKNQ